MSDRRQQDTLEQELWEQEEADRLAELEHSMQLLAADPGYHEWLDKLERERDASKR